LDRVKNALGCIAGGLVLIAFAVIWFWAWDEFPDIVLLVIGIMAAVLGYGFLLGIIDIARKDPHGSLIVYALYILIPIGMLVFGELMIIAALRH